MTDNNGYFADRAALGIIFDTTSRPESEIERNDGVNWINHGGWKMDEPLGDWFGVTLNADGRVEVLVLRKNRCTGSIPREVGMLSALVELDLSSNLLKGPIPQDLSQLSSLTKLDLSLNALTGAIPTELGGLSALAVLDLSYNNLQGTIPEELGNLRSLQLLGLQRNRLSGSIPLPLYELATLQAFYWPQNDGFTISGPKYRGPKDAMRSNLQIYSFRGRGALQVKAFDGQTSPVDDLDVTRASSQDSVTADGQKEKATAPQDKPVSTDFPGRCQNKKPHGGRNAVIASDFPRRRPVFSLDDAGRRSSRNINNDKHTRSEQASSDLSRRYRTSNIFGARNSPSPMDLPRRRPGFSEDIAGKRSARNSSEGATDGGDLDQEDNHGSNNDISPRGTKSRHSRPSRRLGRSPIPIDLPRRRTGLSLDPARRSSRSMIDTARSGSGDLTDGDEGEPGSSVLQRHLNTKFLSNRSLPTLDDLPRRRSEHSFEVTSRRARSMMDDTRSGSGELINGDQSELGLSDLHQRHLNTNFLSNRRLPTAIDLPRRRSEHSFEVTSRRARSMMDDTRTGSGELTNGDKGELGWSDLRQRYLNTNFLPNRRLPTAIDLPRRRSEHSFEVTNRRARARSLTRTATREANDHGFTTERESVPDRRCQISRINGSHTEGSYEESGNTVVMPGSTESPVSRGRRWGLCQTRPKMVDLPRRFSHHNLVSKRRISQEVVVLACDDAANQVG